MNTEPEYERMAEDYSKLAKNWRRFAGWESILACWCLGLGGGSLVSLFHHYSLMMTILGVVYLSGSALNVREPPRVTDEVQKVGPTHPGAEGICQGSGEGRIRTLSRMEMAHDQLMASFQDLEKM